MPKNKKLLGAGSVIRKRVKAKKITKYEVLKQLQAAMDTSKDTVVEDKPPKELENEFFTTGRIGRRNALPDITENCTTGTADLPDNFSALSTQDQKNSAQPGPSDPGTSDGSSKT